MRPVHAVCAPRAEVLEGTLVEDIFAAELTPVVTGTAPPVYGDAEKFFANTYATQGLSDLMTEVFGRLSGKGGNPLIRLETSFGGGKTHGLIALYHAAKQAKKVPTELLAAKLRPSGEVAVAAVSGRDFGLEGREHDGLHVETLWGEVAWQLGGGEAYAAVAETDRLGIAPSSDALLEVLPDGPVLVMLDELGRYLRVAQGRKLAGRGTLADQVPAFLHSLAAAASMRAQAVVVITLAGDQDAYAAESEELRAQLQKADQLLDETQRVAARQEMVIRPTHDEEVASVVVRRLFERVDGKAAKETAKQYHEFYQSAVQNQNADLPPRAVRADYRKELERTYPFHPELLHVLMTKTASIPEFQRTRGALRLLARVVRSVWEHEDPDAWLIQPYHLDFADEDTRNDLTGRLGPDRAELAPVVQADIYSDAGDSHAQELDREWLERDRPPLATRVAGVVFLHSLTHGRAARAELPEVLLACAQPEADVELIREALQGLERTCWYMHSDETAFWFNKEVSPNKVIEETLEQITSAQGKEECRKRLQGIYSGGQLLMVPMPERPADVDDKSDRIRLCVMDFDFASVSGSDAVPDTIRRIYEKAGTQEGFRTYHNALVFLVADPLETTRMVDAARRHRALQHIVGTPDIMAQLTEHNQKDIRGRLGSAEVEVRVAITRAYRHLLVPDPDGASDGSGLHMLTLDVEQATKLERDRKPGKAGQEKVVIDALIEHGKLMKPDGPAPAPQLVMEIGWPKGQQTMTTEELSKVFRRQPRLPMLLDSHRLRATVIAGVEQECWVYFDGERMHNKQIGAPAEADVRLDAKHELWTVAEANARGYCGKCGYLPCRCVGPKLKCPKCKKLREDCTCPPCTICGGKPWECQCGKVPRGFDSGATSPQKAFAAFDDWAKDNKVERIQWLEVECHDRPADMQQVWIGMQYFASLEQLTAEFDGTLEIVSMERAGAQDTMQSDTVRVESTGAGKTFRRVFDFYHAMAQGLEHVGYYLRLRAQLSAPLAPSAGEIADLRQRLETSGVLQITLRAGVP